MTLRDKRNFANVIKRRTLKCRDNVESPLWAQSYYESLNLEDLSLLWSKTETVGGEGFSDSEGFRSVTGSEMSGVMGKDQREVRLEVEKLWVKTSIGCVWGKTV